MIIERKDAPILVEFGSLSGGACFFHHNYLYVKAYGVEEGSHTSAVRLQDGARVYLKPEFQVEFVPSARVSY